MEKIGFIGLGIMGKPMVKNLLNAGFETVVFNRSSPAILEVAELGAVAAATIADVVKNSEIIITMLPDTPDVEAVLIGAGGVFENARPGQLVIDMSTISPVATREFASKASAAGISMADAPVSGGDKGAIAGTLSIMFGGEVADFERARPVFEAIGKTIVHCGAVGSGQTVKACNQVVVALVIEAVSEALVLGSKAGVKPEVILEVLGGGLAQNRVMELRGPTMIKHDFQPGFKAKLHKKDLNIVLQTAGEFGVTLPATAMVEQMLTKLVDEGKGDLDHSALLTVLEDMSDHRVDLPQ